MSTDLIHEITTETVQALLREIGWEAELAGTKDQPQVVSSVAGVNFNIRFGTAAPSKAGWRDFTISAPFAVDREVSPVIGAFWNRRNRFARVYRTQEQLLLDMDVILAGGVSRDHVKYMLAVWADVARLFVNHLRADSAVLARYKAAGAGRTSVANAPASGGSAVADGVAANTRRKPAGYPAQSNGKAAGLEEQAHASGSS